MSARTAPNPHLPADALLDYWLGDSDATATEAADAHLLACDACGQALDELIALGHGIRDAFRAGAVGGVFSAGFVQRLAGQGVQVRAYRVAPGGSVNCTVAPGDELLVSHLALPQPLHGVQRLDLQVELSLAPGVRHELNDIPFDAQAGELLYVSRLDVVRPLPAHTVQVTLRAGEGAAARELARYRFHHQPWAGGA